MAAAASSCSPATSRGPWRRCARQASRWCGAPRWACPERSELKLRQPVLQSLGLGQMPLEDRQQLADEPFHLWIVDPRQGTAGPVDDHLVIVDHRLHELA